MNRSCLSEPGSEALVDKEARQDNGEQRSQHHSNDQGNEAGVQDQRGSCTTPRLGQAASCTEGQGNWSLFFPPTSRLQKCQNNAKPSGSVQHVRPLLIAHG